MAPQRYNASREADRKVTITIVFFSTAAVLCFIWLLRETLSSAFIGPQTRLVYKCKENPRVHKDCPKILRDRGLYSDPEDEDQFSVGVDPVELAKSL